jgi:uncharacterized protein (DUF1501 family)
MNRRRLLFYGGAGALALVGTPAFCTDVPAAKKIRLVVVFQRGAADGLGMVIPFRDPIYYKLRPNLSVPEKALLALDGTFGLHPALGALAPLYKSGQLAIVHNAGSPDPTRSHFDAQDFMETGTPGVKSTRDGWLNRALQAEDAKNGLDPAIYRAVAVGTHYPRTLQGKIPAICFSSVRGFAISNRAENSLSSYDSLAGMYANSGDTALRDAGRETFSAMDQLWRTNPLQYKSAKDAHYPETEFGQSMRQIAQLMKSGLGVEVAFSETGGWDTHQSQGNAQGPMADLMRDFADTIAAFWRDLGDSAENVVLVTMSEFGRTVAENGSGGTDHGHGSVMFVLGAPIKGGKIYGRWMGLEPEALNDGRDLPVTTDYRTVLAELLSGKTGAAGLAATFPGAREAVDSKNFLGLT